MTLQKGSKIGCVTSGVSFLGKWRRMEGCKTLVDYGNYGARVVFSGSIEVEVFFSPISSHLLKRVLMF